MGQLSLLQLRLSHFRSHRYTNIETDGRPVVLHGPNGAGKTNILEAISLLSPGRGLRRSGPEDMARRPEAIGWKVNASLTGPSGLQEIETGSQDNATRSVQIDGKPASQLALARTVRVLWLVGLIPVLSGAGRIIAGLSIRPARFTATDRKSLEQVDTTSDQQPFIVTSSRSVPASVTDHTTHLLEPPE